MAFLWKASLTRLLSVGKLPQSGNFITDTVLTDYVHAFTKSPEEIIFGTPDELEELLRDILDKLFFTVLLKDLTKHADLYKNVDQLNVEAQKTVISFAELFAEYNLQRYHFLKSDETCMDSLQKDMDREFSFGEKIVNNERDFRTKPINEDTVVDRWDMNEKMWLMCKETMIRSFRAEVLNSLFDEFKYSTLNIKVHRWLNQQFCQVIVPNLIAKLKNNAIFKIGLMVHYLINELLNENLAESFQKTVPLKISRPEQTEIFFKNRVARGKQPPTREQAAKEQEMFELATMYVRKGEMPDAELTAELAKHGITIIKKPAIEITDEVAIDQILQRAFFAKRNGPTVSKQPVFEQSPVFQLSGSPSPEELSALTDYWLEMEYFNNQMIPGYFTNNSQIVERLQEHLNEQILDSIKEFIYIQNNLLKLLSDEDLVAFAK